MKKLSHNKRIQKKKTAGEILSRLPEVFGVREVEKYVRYPGLWASRVAASGRILRLQRGTYWNRFRYPDLSLPYLACQIKSDPSYISCEWALHARGVLLQRPFVCTVVTLSTAVGRGREVALMGETIEFSKIDESLFWGYEPVEGYFLASAEKAYLDTFHYHRDPERWGEIEKDMLDLKAFQSMAAKFPKRTVKRIRIGN